MCRIAGRYGRCPTLIDCVTIPSPRADVFRGQSVADRSVVVHGEGAWAKNNEGGVYSLSRTLSCLGITGALPYRHFGLGGPWRTKVWIGEIVRELMVQACPEQAVGPFCRLCW